MTRDGLKQAIGVPGSGNLNDLIADAAGKIWYARDGAIGVITP
jgi:hypothetical protein